MTKRRTVFALLAICTLALASFPSAQRGAALPRDTDLFLEDLSKRTFMFFWEQADPATGIIRDRFSRRRRADRTGRTHR